MKILVAMAAAMAVFATATMAGAQGRYVEPPPLVVSPDLSAPWVMQLRQAPQGGQPARVRPPQGQTRQLTYEQWRALQRRAAPAPRAPRPAASQPRQAVLGTRTLESARTFGGMDPIFLPREVAYEGPHRPGTLVVDTNERFLYLVLEDGRARRYGVGVGKEGFEWKGTETISQKRQWPDWRPPAEMIERERNKGRTLPTLVKGGPSNPLGARALYLGSTLYRIHGTNAPWSIGQAVSSGCIRMRNEDVIELYELVSVGARVVVI